MIDKKDCVLVLNLGLRSIRTVVFDEKGNKIAHEWLPVRSYVHHHQVEQDPEEWWKLALRTIKETTIDPEIRKRIGYITATSSSCNLVLLDSGGKCLGRSLMVSDKRSHVQANEFKEDKEFSYLFSHPNLLPVASFIPPKILWLRKHENERFKKTRWFLPSDSFLLYKFCDVIATDSLNAEKMYYDTREGNYSQGLLEKLGLGKEQLPPVLDVGTILGDTTDEFTKQTGIRAKVVLTTYDALAAFWGTGVTEPGQACIVCGTCSSVRVYSNNPLEKKANELLSQYFSHNDSHVVGGSNNLEGGLLEWAKEALYPDSYTQDDNYLFSLMEREASESTVGANGLVFLPYLLGERAPFYDQDVRGIFFGLDRSHNRKDMIRAVFEAIGYLSKDMISALESQGTPVNELRLSGGLGKTELISQIKADITGKKVLLLEEAESTALGCFLLVAHATGADIQISDLVKVKKSFVPNEDNHLNYQKIYSLFKQIYDSNKENFALRARLLKEMSSDTLKEIKNL